MTPREWVGCVVGLRYTSGGVCSGVGYATVHRAWRRKRDGALTRVVLVWGEGTARETERRYRVRSVERHSGSVPERTLVLGGAW